MSNEYDGNNNTDEKSVIGASQKVVEAFVDDVQSLWLQHHQNDSITILNHPPTNIQFLRDFVAPNRPCIIRNVNMIGKTTNGTSQTSDRSVLLDTLVAQDPDLLFIVDVTPDGYGDCLRQVKIPIKEEIIQTSSLPPETITNNNNNMKYTIHECFVQPLQRRMTIRQFHHRLQCQLRTRQKLEQQQTQKDVIMNRIFDTIQIENDCVEETEVEVERDIENISDDDIDLYDENDNFGIVYYSRQNDCLRNGELSSNIWDTLNMPSTIDFTNGVFCNSTNDEADNNNIDSHNSPAAMNLWIGNECSTSYLHKDYYENLYYVVSGGEKIVTLCPPSDIVFVEEKEYISGQFVQDKETKEWKVRLDSSIDNNSKVRWIGGDVTRKDNIEQQHKYPMIQYTSPITVRVKPNEMIYIPSLWLHHITQISSSSSFSNEDNNNAVATVAVNYWYEMNFSSPLYVYFHLLQQMKINDRQNNIEQRPSH